MIGEPLGPWPFHDPTADGEHIGTIVAAYMKEGSLAIIVEMPSGATFEGFITNVNLRPKEF